MQTAPKESSKTPSLLGWYMENGTNLYRVVAHTKHNITLEDCYSNMHTVYNFDEFVALKLRKVERADSD